MKKIFLFIYTIFTLLVKGQITPSEQTKVDSLFKKFNNNSTPGAVMGIIKDGKFIYTQSYGMADLEHAVAITDSTVFYIGSVSKQFTAMCILLLEEQGKLKLNDPVQKYLPDFPIYNAPLTIGNFMNHTSGVRDNLTLWALAGKDYLDHIDKEEMYQLIRRQKELNYTPGEQFMYSNACYFMLGLIIEKVAGESLHEFARKNIFEPLGMHHTFFQDDNTNIIKNRAFSYIEEDGKFKNQLMRYDLVGSGGIYSTIKDLYLWDQNFYQNKLGKGTMLLIEKLHMEIPLNNGKLSGVGYANGVQNGVYRGLKTVRHGGALAGYRSYLYRFPEKHFSIVILGNINSINVDRLPFEIANIMLEKELNPLPAPQANISSTSPTSEKEKEIDIKNINEYSGTYYSEELNTNYQFMVKGKDLLYCINNCTPAIVHPVSQDTFKIDGYIVVKFEKDNKNRISGFSLNTESVKNIGFKIIN